MGRPVQVGASYGDPWLVLPGLLTAAGVIGSGVARWAADDPNLATGVLVPTAAFAVMAPLQLWRVVRACRSLEPTPDGVLLADRHGNLEVSDDAVVDLATELLTDYSNGVPSRRRRVGSLVVAAPDGERVARIGYTFPLGSPDPLGDWLARVFGKLVRRAEATIAAGGRLVGDDWVLTAEWLERGPTRLPLADIASAGVADGQVCVWVRGATEATVRIPAGSPNALVLQTVLDAWLAAQSDPTPEPTDALGRLVFERDRSLARWKLVGGWLLVGVMLLIAAVCVTMQRNARDGGPPGWVFALFLGVIGAGLAYHLMNNRVNHIKVYERGITLRRPRRTLQLCWADCGSYTHSATRVYIKGGYVGTDIRLRFEPIPGASSDRVTYSARVKNADEELDRLRGWVGRAVADRLEARVRAGEEVQWLPGAAFVRAGLELRRAGWLGRRLAELVPYARVGTYQMKDGRFWLTLDGERRPAVSGRTDTANFFPGLELLQRFAARASAG